MVIETNVGPLLTRFNAIYPPDCKVKSHNGADLRIFFSRQHNTITVLKMPFLSNNVQYLTNRFSL